MDIRPIKTPEDHKVALARIDELMDAEEGTPEVAELEVLCQFNLENLQEGLKVHHDASPSTIAAFGLVPLLFATGPGSEIQKPLAIVVIGGLVTATLLTLVLLPILYERFGESAGEHDEETSGGYDA